MVVQSIERKPRDFVSWYSIGPAHTSSLSATMVDCVVCLQLCLGLSSIVCSLELKPSRHCRFLHGELHHHFCDLYSLMQGPRVLRLCKQLDVQAQILAIREEASRSLVV